VRDFGGLKVHLLTLNASLGRDTNSDEEEWVKEGHSVLVDDVKECAVRWWGALVGNHLQVRIS
jgi:hypothetical protein